MKSDAQDVPSVIGSMDWLRKPCDSLPLLSFKARKQVHFYSLLTN